LIQRSFGMFDPMHNPSAGTLENAWRASANVFPTSSGEPVSCPTRKSGEMGSSSAGRSRGSSTDRGGLAVRLLIARRRCGLSRREVASRLSVTVAAVAHWENPKGAKPRIDRLNRLAELLSVDIGWLLSDLPLPEPTYGASTVVDRRAGCQLHGCENSQAKQRRRP
jgi:DNA-binding XRE family transcriptional regulator